MAASLLRTAAVTAWFGLVSAVNSGTAACFIETNDNLFRTIKTLADMGWSEEAGSSSLG